jgi:hypothetical protein
LPSPPTPKGPGAPGRGSAARAKPGAEPQHPLDKLMDRASAALAAAKYFEAERLASQALFKAFRLSDFERMARIVLPLQEARRQKRQIAEDTGSVFILSSLAALDQSPMPGMFLFQPPLIGADARGFREVADSQHIPVFTLTREPMSRDGLWPVVTVGDVSIRTKVAPPYTVARLETGPTRDDSARFGPPPVEWFTRASEALGDAAIAKLNPADPAAWRVEDMLLATEAHPAHEKLHQALAACCREAIGQPLPEGRRPRPMIDDPFSF